MPYMVKLLGCKVSQVVLVSYLFPVDEPPKCCSWVAVIASTVQVDPVTDSIVLALVARDHREPLRQTYHCQLSTLL